MARIDFIIPVFNEGPALERFHASIAAVTSALPQYAFRFLYVNDGSSDETSVVLGRMTAADPRVFAIELARNFGHQAASESIIGQARKCRVRQPIAVRKRGEKSNFHFAD